MTDRSRPSASAGASRAGLGWLQAPGYALGELSETRFWMYLLLVPSLVLILAVVLYPTLSGIELSFQTMRLNRPANNGFAGLAQYERLLNDPVFWLALRNTAIWVTFTIILEFGLGLITALALNRNLPGTPIFAVLLLVPYFLPNVVAGNIWALLIDSRVGVINDILVRVGVLDAYKAWFADPNTAMGAAIVVEVWHSFPFFTLLLLAGLKGIPVDLYKAATVDGAGRLAQLRWVTLPMLRTIIAAAVILRVIGLVNSPDLLLILTGGGPGRVTQVLSLYAFQTAYQDFNFGYAGALSVAMLVLLMVFAWLYVRLSRVNEE